MRHTPLLLAASLTGALALFACFESENPSTPNTTPELLEAANFACVGGGANDPLYAERRVLLESQGWWGERRTDGTVPQYGNAEHIHVALCFPLKQTVSGTRRVVVRVQGHRLKVNSKITSTSLHDPAQGDGEGIGLASIGWNRVITAADNGTFDSTAVRDIDTRDMPNGLREFRNLTKVERPGGTDEIHASSGWCWNVNNSTSNSTDPPGPSGTCATAPNQTSARGWYSCFEYKIAEVRNWAAETAPATLYPFGGIPRNTAYTLTIGARDGAGKLGHTDFDRWEVRLDPNFHAGDRGTLIDSGTGPANGETVTIGGTLLTGPTVHKVVVLGFSNDDCSAAQQGELAAVFAVPLKVN